MKNFLFSFVFCCLSGAVCAQSTVTDANGWEYSVSNNQATLVKAPSAKGNITIPATVSNNGTAFPVVAVSVGNTGVFQGNTAITGITFQGNNLKTIGKHAFKDCTKLTSVIIPSGVASLPAGTFAGCSGLKTVFLPESVTEIGDSCFINCTSLTAIDGAQGLEYIYSRALQNCKVLAKLNLTSAVSHIYPYAFETTPNYKANIDLSGNKYLWVGNHAFHNSGITGFRFPDTAELENKARKPNGFEGYQFNGCHNLATIKLPANPSLKELPEGFFCNENTETLQYVSIPANFNKLGNAVFNFCNGLKEVAFLGAGDFSHGSTGEPTSVIYYVTDQCTTTNKKYVIKKAYPLAMTADKYVTFSSICPLDFSGTGLKVYVAKYDNGNIIYNEVSEGKIPAGAGVLVYDEKATAAVSYNIKVIPSAEALSGNGLTGTPDLKKICDGTQYELGVVNNVLGWCKVAVGKSIAVNKAYLTIPASADAKDFIPLKLDEIVPDPSINIEIGSTGYATAYYGNQALTVPTGVTASTYAVVDGKLTATKTYASGEVVPKGTGVVLKGTANTTYTFDVSSETGEVPSLNQLYGSDEKAETSVSDATHYYMLSLDSEGKNAGFYWGADNGAAFTNGAHKAYLALNSTATANVKAFLFDGGTVTTGISTINAKACNAKHVYTLSGMRMGSKKLPAGVYIRNGRKFVVK